MKLKKTLSVMLLVSLLLSVVGCMGRQAKKPATPELVSEFSAAQPQQYTFSAQPSQTVTLSSDGAARVMDVIAQQQAEYTYEDVYGLEEVRSRLDFDAAVQKHIYSAWNEEGRPDGEYLTKLVLANNATYMESAPEFDQKQPEQTYIAELCAYIVQIVMQMQERYPDIDWERVSCNLGNLKILYDSGNLSYASVTQDMVLELNENNAVLLEMKEGKSGFSKVLIHEIMHIIQMGCACEEIEGCERRAGICVYWNDLTVSYGDWTWLVEGSAERAMCALTGAEATTYQYKIDYLCSMNMAVLLRDDVQADTIQTLCFYDDPQRLFDAFGAVTEAEKEEILKMMITIEVLQNQPVGFYEDMVKAGYEDPRVEGSTPEAFSYSLKAAPCITLAKEFYENLLTVVQEQAVPIHDLFFLINLFEGHINQHLRCENQDRVAYNAPFMESAVAMRETLFEALEAENPGLDAAQLYENYRIADGQTLNGELAMLSPEERDFLAERAKWQEDGLSLGIKMTRP